MDGIQLNIFTNRPAQINATICASVAKMEFLNWNTQNSTSITMQENMWHDNVKIGHLLTWTADHLEWIKENFLSSIGI